MAMLIYRMMLMFCFTTCLASFAWGMWKVFVLPERNTSGMKMVASFSVIFALLHFWVVAETSSLDGSRVYTGVAFYLSALGLFWWTTGTTGKRYLPACYTQLQPSAVITQGPYSWMRHPFYTAYLIAWVAGAESTSNAWLLGGSVVMCSVYAIAAHREEETLLTGILALEYRRYCCRTGMFFPKCWKTGNARS